MKSPVELLRDKKGVYGIGVAEQVDVDPGGERPYLLLRPDRLHFSSEASYHGAVLQGITSGLHQRVFDRTLEEQFRQVIHHEALNRAGLPSSSWGSIGYTSTDKKHQNRERQLFHGLRIHSVRIVNELTGRAREEAAVPEALMQARRFAFRVRQPIYQAGATSPRRLQLIHTFPTLALAIFCPRYDGVLGVGGVPSRLAKQINEALSLVERGAPLGQIADLMGVPKAMRHVKPGAAHCALDTLKYCEWDTRLVNTYMPSPLPKMKLWLGAVRFASQLGPEFVQWVAGKALQIEAGRLDGIADWVRTCYHRSVPSNVHWAIRDSGLDLHASHGDAFVTRSFSPDMSLSTVLQLSDDWHEAIAKNLGGPAYAFPEPWCKAGVVGDYEIVPITSSADLYREGHAMRHCVSTYEDQVRHGDNCFVSVRYRGKRAATALIHGPRERATISQLRGPCNSRVHKNVERAVHRWLRPTFHRAKAGSDIEVDIGLDEEFYEISL